MEARGPVRCPCDECLLAPSLSLHQEIFFLRLPALGRRCQPARHPTTSSPGVSGIVRIAVLNGNLAAFASAAIDEVTDVESRIFCDLGDLRTQRRALGILLLDFYPLDAGLHRRELSRRHIL